MFSLLILFHSSVAVSLVSFLNIYFFILKILFSVIVANVTACDAEAG